MPSGKKRTHEEFIEELSIQNPNSKDFIVLDKYVSNVSKIRCQCKLCGKIWDTTPKQLLQDKQKCPYCQNATRQLTHEEYVSRVKANNPHYDKFVFLSEYKNMMTPIKLSCKQCGHVWQTKPYDLASRGLDCPCCSGNATATREMFLKKFASKNSHFGEIEVCSEYKGAAQRIDCKCKVCGHKWSPLATSLVQGSGCPECAKKRIAKSNVKFLIKGRENNPAMTPLTNEEFLTKLKEKNPHYEGFDVISPYLTSKDRVKCKCKKCGKIWETLPTSLLNGSGCPECAHTSTSFMEQFVFRALKEALSKYKVINRDKKLIGRELDILVPDFNFAVEIGSWKWHKKVFHDDLNKQMLCKKKRIDLLIIYDVCNRNDFNNDLIMSYPFDLSNEKDYKSLKEIVLIILNKIGVNHSFNNASWNRIVELAYKNSQRIDFEEFNRRFKEGNDDYDNIEIIGPYTKLSSKIKCRCKKCGHIWEVVAFDLLRNSGCLKCRNKEVRATKRKVNLIAEWRKKNPNGNKKQCHIETGISYATVLKWWDGEKND